MERATKHLLTLVYARDVRRYLGVVFIGPRQVRAEHATGESESVGPHIVQAGEIADESCAKPSVSFDG